MVIRMKLSRMLLSAQIFTAAATAAIDIPLLAWPKMSDWTDVTKISPLAAKGNGVADDDPAAGVFIIAISVLKTCAMRYGLYFLGAMNRLW